MSLSSFVRNLLVMVDYIYYPGLRIMLESKPTDDQWKAFFRGESSQEEYTWLKTLLDRGEAEEILGCLFKQEPLAISISFRIDKKTILKHVLRKIKISRMVKSY